MTDKYASKLPPDGEVPASVGGPPTDEEMEQAADDPAETTDPVADYFDRIQTEGEPNG